jgi:hypothetical protein
MNMTTNIDNIPLKTNKNDIQEDDSDDPMVKDILNEFEKELKVNNPSVPAKPDYVINYPQPPQQACPIPMKKAKAATGYYNEEFLRKTAIIIIIIALIFSPVIFATFVERLPASFTEMFDNYNYYVKLMISFVAIYLLFYYNLL